MSNRSVSTRELQALMAAARVDSVKEDIFLRALLDATLYAHVPKSRPPAGRMQFVQFRWPKTQQFVLPIFSSMERADFAAVGKVGIVGMPGRRLLELTLGATLMLDPNDEGVSLYPAEARALLAGRTLAPAARVEVLSEDVPVQTFKPAEDTAALCALLAAYFDQEAEVSSAYLTEVRRGSDHEDVFLLVTVIADLRCSEFIARTCGQLLTERPVSPLPVTFTFHAPSAPLPRLCITSVHIFDRIAHWTAS